MTIRQRAEELAKQFESKYGHRAASLGSESYKLNVVPTGSLSLDYALGTGGWPLGHPVEVFGAPDIGKSSVLGFSALRNAQALGKFCALVALEPGFDPHWAAKNGVDIDELVIARPSSGEDAFSILLDCIHGGAEYIVFDSIGALVTAAEIDKDEMKSRVGGQSKLITDGVKRALMPAWKNNVGIMFLNQQRDDMNSRIPNQVESPGGWALKHSAAIRVHLRSVGKPLKAKIAGEDDEVVVGRELVAVIKRNKLAEGTNRKGQFIYYQMDTSDRKVGIDQTQDVIATGMRTGVISKSGSFYSHTSFPKSLQGKPAVHEFFEQHPESVGSIRNDVLAHMHKKQEERKQTEPNLKVADGEEGQ